VAHGLEHPRAGRVLAWLARVISGVPREQRVTGRAGARECGYMPKEARLAVRTARVAGGIFGISQAARMPANAPHRCPCQLIAWSVGRIPVHREPSSNSTTTPPASWLSFFVNSPRLMRNATQP